MAAVAAIQKTDAGIQQDALREVQPPPIDPAQVRKAIEAAIERQAHRESNRISLLIHDGHVKVLGSVRTGAEREAVLGAAKETPGVRSVEEALRIDPGL